MDESERLERYKRAEDDREDRLFSDRIALLLNHPKIDKYCMVDAYYYDFSAIPDAIREKLQLCRDVYLIFGITIEGEMISKWVERWDLDSEDPIVDGKVIHSANPANGGAFIVPEINQCFASKLLSMPAPDFLKIFNCDHTLPPIINEVDVSKMALCENCKNKVVDEFIKAFRRYDEWGKSWN